MKHNQTSSKWQWKLILQISSMVLMLSGISYVLKASPSALLSDQAKHVHLQSDTFKQTTSTQTSAKEPSTTITLPPQNKPEWNNKKVLHIGDSMLSNWGLKGTLRKKFTAAGAKYMVSAKKGSNSHSWLVTGLLRKTLREKNPDIVIINLGSNAVKYRHPENYTQWIEKLIKKIEPRQCYWISPPGLIPDKYGFFEMLKNSTVPCKFFDSRQAHFKRTSKKSFHLNRKQSQKWADMIWNWMNNTEQQSQPADAADGF